MKEIWLVKNVTYYGSPVVAACKTEADALALSVAINDQLKDDPAEDHVVKVPVFGRSE